MSGRSPYALHRELVDSIERNFRVQQWGVRDVDLWPVASQDLFGDLFRQAAAETAPAPPPFVVRAASALATPITNIWKSRRDLSHYQRRPYEADAILLGDGVSLDRVDDGWRDRFSDPIIAAVERQGRRCFMMQSGNLARLPWARPTYAANRVAARAALKSALTKGPTPDVPDHADVISLVERHGIEAPSLSVERLARRARTIAAQAGEFDRILLNVKPKIAFVVTYYAGLGHAFALSCRRRGILCVDLQHCPHDSGHRAYRWSQLPRRGYSTLPGLFWTWTPEEAGNIRRWSDGLWHRAIAGGHAQIAALGNEESDRLWQRAAGGSAVKFEREILVALQPVGGKGEIWNALADEIERGPATWRWWIRRHPASTSTQDRNYARLLSLTGANVVAGEQAQTPLPALLRHMDALVSLASGAAAEAAMFGVPAFFLDDEAHDTFPGLIAGGDAVVIQANALIAAIADGPPTRPRIRIGSPPIEQTLDEIERIAEDYSRLCREPAGEKCDCDRRVASQSQAPRAA